MEVPSNPVGLPDHEQTDFRSVDIGVMRMEKGEDNLEARYLPIPQKFPPHKPFTRSDL